MVSQAETFVVILKQCCYHGYPHSIVLSELYTSVLNPMPIGSILKITAVVNLRCGDARANTKLWTICKVMHQKLSFAFIFVLSHTISIFLKQANAYGDAILGTEVNLDPFPSRNHSQLTIINKTLFDPGVIYK